jgi:carbon storage regulator CsrA
MLVLSRKLNESIQIGDRITLRVVQIRGNRVRLGIVAPAEVRIMRQELESQEPAAVAATSEATATEEAAAEDAPEPAVVVPPFVAEAVSDVMAPELEGDDADHWPAEVARRPPAFRNRRLRMFMPEVENAAIAK